MKAPKKFRDRYTEYPASDLTKHASDILNEVHHGGLPVVISKHDKPLVFMAPLSLLDALELGLIKKLDEERARIATMTREIRKDLKDQTVDADAPPATRAKEAPSPRGAHDEERLEKTIAVAVTRKARR